MEREDAVRDSRPVAHKPPTHRMSPVELAKEEERLAAVVAHANANLARYRAQLATRRRPTARTLARHPVVRLTGLTVVLILAAWIVWRYIGQPSSAQPAPFVSERALTPERVARTTGSGTIDPAGARLPATRPTAPVTDADVRGEPATPGTAQSLAAVGSRAARAASLAADADRSVVAKAAASGSARAEQVRTAPRAPTSPVTRARPVVDQGPRATTVGRLPPAPGRGEPRVEEPPIPVSTPSARLETRDAVLLSSPVPRYPSSVRIAQTGVVEVEIRVDTDGRVTHAEALAGPPLLRGIAEEVVRQWRYQPALTDGVPVESRRRVRISFR